MDGRHPGHINLSPATMHITLKLFASLSRHLPEGAERNQVRIEVHDGTTPADIVERFNVPLNLAHLVLVNGVFVARGERGTHTLKDGDELAIFPPVAGG
jgi:thiamine biosynthesis protein ThiS